LTTYQQITERLISSPKTWLITGVAGFIGSNLLETLLKFNQNVTGLDNFSTGYPHNLDQVKETVDKKSWQRFRFVDGDIRDAALCNRITRGCDYVLHQAAMASVPKSIEHPVEAEEINCLGFLNMLAAAKNARVKKLVYASSSAVYGDDIKPLKVEEKIGNPMSPYAVTKRANELYAHSFSTTCKVSVAGLRYFNIFGPRQDPNGAYAAVIPKWVSQCLAGEPCTINGDGKTSRDFCHVDNVVQANILAATQPQEGLSAVYNVGTGESTSLSELYDLIVSVTTELTQQDSKAYLAYAPARDGDIRHSTADISLAKKKLHYVPDVSMRQGMEDYIKDEWEKFNIEQAESRMAHKSKILGEPLPGRAFTENTFTHSVQ